MESSRHSYTIFSEYAIDLLIDPMTRGTTDVSHTIAAIASSSGKDRAEAFRSKVQAPTDCACYGDYEALASDTNVDIVYIASPHSHHFQHTMLCLLADKHVVCEKPITVNAAQAKILYQTARERNLFLLDAVWTRYFPLSVQIREIIQSGEIGEVLRVFADTSMGEDVDDLWINQRRRKVDLNLAGGALLESQFTLLPEADETLRAFVLISQSASIRLPGYSKPCTTHYPKTRDGLRTRSCHIWSNIQRQELTKTRLL